MSLYLKRLKTIYVDSFPLSLTYATCCWEQRQSVKGKTLNQQRFNGRKHFINSYISNFDLYLKVIEMTVLEASPGQL